MDEKNARPVLLLKRRFLAMAAPVVCLLVACGESATEHATQTDAAVDHQGGYSGVGGAASGGVGVGGLGDGGCTGIAVPCAESGVACANNPGCHPQQLCVANGCTVFVDGSCEGQPGCTWDNDAGTCAPPNCDIFDAGSCPTDAGCYVMPGCEGEPAPCAELESCAYPGCLYQL